MSIRINYFFEHKIDEGALISIATMPINADILCLLKCPSFTIAKLLKNDFNTNLQIMLKKITNKKNAFVVFAFMQFCSSIEKNNINAFLAQLRYFATSSEHFSPLKFQCAYDELDFSSVMNYKAFLQKISYDHYGRMVLNIIERNDMRQRQNKAFCTMDTSLKALMHKLTASNWTLSKYLIGDYVIIANEQNLEMHPVEYGKYPDIFNEYATFIESLPLQHCGDYVMSDRHLYKEVERNNLSMVSSIIPEILRSKINDLHIMIEHKKIYLRDLTVVCFCYKTEQLADLNLKLGTKCIFGNGQRLKHRYH